MHYESTLKKKAFSILKGLLAEKVYVIPKTPIIASSNHIITRNCPNTRLNQMQVKSISPTLSQSIEYKSPTDVLSCQAKIPSSTKFERLFNILVSGEKSIKSPS